MAVGLALGEWLLIGVLIVLVPATGYALYSRYGSGISRHPMQRQSPPEHPDRRQLDEPGGTERPGVDESGGSALDQSGTDTKA